MCCLAEFLVKYILFFANLVFSLVGIVLIGLGIAVLVQLSDVLEIVPGIVNAIPITVIVLGSIVFAIACFGCCGAIRESRCLLTMYAVCMAILAGGKIYLTVVIFQGLANIYSTVNDWVITSFEQYNHDEPNVNQPFDLLQIAFQCCGTSGAGVYNGSLPLSCCPITSPPSTSCTDDAYAIGCSERLADYFDTFGEAIGGLLIVIIIFELVAMLFGLFLCSSVNKRR